MPAAETFPREKLAQAVIAGGVAGGNALQYDWPEGRQGLRTWIATRLAARGAAVSSEDVLVTSGAQQALDIAVQLLAADGGRIGVPAVCYPGALDLFSARRARLVPDGPAKVRYAMPALSNPTGLSLTESAVDALVESGDLVLEDDAYAELRFDGRVPKSLISRAPERVIHVGTLSKTLCPGLRIGWLVTPPGLRDRARRCKQVADLQGNTFTQGVVEGYLAQDDYDDRLEGLRALYARRADALVTAVRRELPSFSFVEPEGGFSLWLTADERGDDIDLLRLSVREGMSFDPGRDFLADPAGAPLCFRLTFSSLPPRFMPEACKRLARALAKQTRSARPSSPLHPLAPVHELEQARHALQ